MWNDVRALNYATGACLVLVALLCLGTLVLWVVRHNSFDLRGIVVRPSGREPLRHVDPALVRALALPQIKGNFFTIDLASAREAFESVPWVRRATVSRQWPAQLVVELEEHKPIGVWGDGRGVDENGQLFVVNEGELEQYEDLPVLDGPEGSERQVVSRLGEARVWFERLGMEVQAIRLSARYAWTIELLPDGAPEGSKPMVLDLGREDADQILQKRVARFVAAFARVRAYWGALPERVDLRYSNGFALKVPGLKFNDTNTKAVGATR
ncbi:cell division protein FtsQ/DivIB [Derxia gummosa]|uniref:Cell division protein FtsQ n=1 Tax=Derxia gummosa DSM 723 TaxID=1121388 RepID=A0A8B6X894_9BURK|nr:cell division protein FtsQ/DivIB [Derxia gummosa]